MPIMLKWLNLMRILVYKVDIYQYLASCPLNYGRADGNYYYFINNHYMIYKSSNNYAKSSANLHVFLYTTKFCLYK